MGLGHAYTSSRNIAQVFCDAELATKATDRDSTVLSSCSFRSETAVLTDKTVMKI